MHDVGDADAECDPASRYQYALGYEVVVAVLGEQPLPCVERGGRSASMSPSHPTSCVPSPIMIGPTTAIAGFRVTTDSRTEIAVNASSGASTVAHDAATSASAVLPGMSWPVRPTRFWRPTSTTADR